MILLLNLEDIKSYNIFFSNKIPNNIYENSNFIKIKYSNNLLILNSIYLEVPFKITKCSYTFNKIKYYFDPLTNSEIILKLCNIENKILNTYTIENKFLKICKLYNQLNNGYIKIYNENKNNMTNKNNTTTIHFLLKISGIWQTNNAIGLTYKFIIRN